MEKIQELTDKLYREGVEKGNAEGMRLVEKAKAEADKLVADARKEADEIVDKARKQAQELDANTKSELKLYAGQALSALKSEIVNVVSDKLVKDTVKELMDQGTREYGDLTSLLLSTQMHGFVYRTGQTPEHVYVSWQDMRCLHQKSPGLTDLGYLQELFSKEDIEDC